MPNTLQGDEMRAIGYGTIGGVVVIVLIMGTTVYATIQHVPGWIDRASIIGSVASILGVPFTLIQVLSTKITAVAARDASEKAATEVRNSYYRYLLLNARRILQEVKSWMTSKKWQAAGMRTNDLAEQVSQLANARPITDEEWVQAARSLRVWAAIFEAGRTNYNLNYSNLDWLKLCSDLQDKIDRECDPLARGG